jgi:hypothetical protein
MRAVHPPPCNGSTRLAVLGCLALGARASADGRAVDPSQLQADNAICRDEVEQAGRVTARRGFSADYIAGQDSPAIKLFYRLHGAARLHARPLEHQSASVQRVANCNHSGPDLPNLEVLDPRRPRWRDCSIFSGRRLWARVRFSGISCTHHATDCSKIGCSLNSTSTTSLGAASLS